jgi:hypothetical protein
LICGGSAGAKADHRLHYVRGVFFGVVTEAQVDEVNRFFAPPGEGEGFTVVVTTCSLEQ